MNVEEERKKREEKKNKGEKKENKENKSEYMNVVINIAIHRGKETDQTYSLHNGLYFFHFFCILRLQAATSKNNIMTTTTTNVIRIGTASF